ncbi:hypothetical protein Hanom_Chr05g00406751 [Helianthus anomalus]
MCEHLDKEPHFNLDRSKMETLFADRNFLKLMKNTEILMLPHFYDMGKIVMCVVFHNIIY